MSFQGIYLKPGLQLFDNQKHNAKLLVTRRKALLSDRVGSGKTCSVLFSFAYLKERGALNNMLVLTPLSAYEKEVWKKDIQKFTKMQCIDLEELIKRCPSYDQLPNFLEKYPIVYGKHSHVKKYLEYMEHILDLPLTLLVEDEVHQLKSPKAELTTLTKALSLHTPFFWGITGSSISKSMEDLYHIVNLIQPWFFGSFTTFRDYYCDVREKVIGKAPNGRLKKALEIVGIKRNRQAEFEQKLSTLIIKGESFLNVQFDYVDYELSKDEQALYTKIAKGINLQPDNDQEDWLSYLLSNDTPEEEPSIKDVERFSSRFIYLQSADDGVLTSEGKLTNISSVKIDKLMELLKEVTAKGESILVYFDFLSTLHAVESRIKQSSIHCRLLLSTGEDVLDGDAITEASCKKIPHVVLCSRASAESASYYFINHVCFFHVPTVPHTFVQFVGRITRKNTLYPDDLHCHIFRSNNIQLYKLFVVSYKAAQLELVQGVEKNIPSDYKTVCAKYEFKEKAKNMLLWGR